jgi:hypothetical protein
MLTNAARRQFIRAITGALAAGCVPGLAAGDRFPVFDGLLHRDKPSARRLGLEPLTAVAHVWRPGVSEMDVDESAVRAAVTRVPFTERTIFLDIEVWELLRVPRHIRDDSILKFTHVAEAVKDARPDLTFGFYGVIPPITYWPLQNRTLPEFQEWIDANAAMQPLAKLVDVVFPSLYTFYDDHPGWITYATQTLNAARQFKKPIYPFLCFEYHDSNPRLRDHEIVTSAWRDQLRFCRANADGVVLWGGYMRNWRDTAPWWRVVQDEFGVESKL